MSKSWTLLGVTIAVLFGVHYFFGGLIQRQILQLSDLGRLAYTLVTEGVSDFWELHFNQSQTIAKLKSQNERLKKDALLCNQKIIELQKKVRLLAPSLYDQNGSYDVKLSKVISYSNLPNLYRVWIDYAPPTTKKDPMVPVIRGIIYPAANGIDSVACGIAIKSSDGRYEAFLNGDSKCSYGVYIGEKKAPGILYGKNQDKIVVKYIPTWMDVKPGDEVVTSGLDNIFFEGVRVGKVKSVSSNNAYKEALVDGYYNPLSPDYFFVIEKVK